MISRRQRSRLYNRAAILIAAFIVSVRLVQTLYQAQQLTPTTNRNLDGKVLHPTNAAYPTFIKKAQGQGWNVWHDSDTPLPPPSSEEECHWSRFRLPTQAFAEPHPMCLYDPLADRWLSNNIKTSGRWADCDSLTYYWHYDVETHQPARNANSPESLYIDIGANIGACVLQVLLTTNATIVAFEPNPSNSFRLTSTLAKMEPHLRKRVYVFPVALGSATGQSHIYAANDNKGNTVVGKQIRDSGAWYQTFEEHVSIPVERLDDLIQQSSIHLVKLDAQGYECYILAGAQNFLQSTRAMHFELEPLMLRSFENCSEAILWNNFEGWDMYKDRLAADKALSSSRLTRMPPVPSGINVIAYNPRVNERPLQQITALGKAATKA